MSEDPASGSERPLKRQKIRDRAMVLPLLGLAMLMPPIASIFQIDARIAGVPFTALYLFGIWGLLILCAAILSRELRDDDEPPHPRGDASNERPGIDPDR